MACPELKTPGPGEDTLQQLRQRIITMFFKSLTSRFEPVVELAKRGLKRVIQQQSLSKELLQSSLRPILVNLAHYKNLSMPLLVGLERLLELLSNWFNPTLGEKLLEHLRRWLEPDPNAAGKTTNVPGQPPQQTNRPPPKDFKIAAAMINLFHLLPQAAGKFLEPLVMLTVQLEQALPASGVHSEVNSLYRAPLCKFLARYAPDAIDFFLQRIDQPQFFFRLLDMLRMQKEGKPLREELCGNAGKIIARAFKWPRTGASSVTDQAASETGVNAETGISGLGGGSDLASYNGLKLVAVLAKHDPAWLASQPELLLELWSRWRSPARAERLRHEELLALSELLESKRLVKCFTNVVLHDKTKVEYLFDVLSVFDAKTCVDFTFLVRFYKTNVAEEFTSAEKHAVLLHFLEAFKTKSMSASELTHATRLIIIPILEATLKDVSTDSDRMEEAKKVLTEDVVASIVNDLLETADDDESSDDSVHTEAMRVQLLRMGTLLIRHVPDELVRHRKELIKFGWNHLKSEDGGAKQFAFVNVCHFLEAYQAPEKIVLQVFVALLRACQPESKDLVRQALGALTPALPKRLPQGDHKYPIWIRYTKKILVEEGHSLPHLIHVWNLIVSHESHFYPSRAQFVPQMVNSLSRLGLPSSSPAENRALSVDLVELVLRWEKSRERRVKEHKEAKGETDKHDDDDDEDADDDDPKKQEPKVGTKRGRRDSNHSAEKKEEKQKDPPKRRRPRRGADTEDDDDDNDDKKNSIMPTANDEKDKDVAMGDADDIDMDNDDDGPRGSGEVPIAPDADDFAPTPGMREIMVNFLVRMSFLTGESKENVMLALHARSLSLLREALNTWPTANIKFAFIEKLLASTAAAGGDATNTLRTGLAVFNVALDADAERFVSGNAPQLAQMLEPCFNSKSQETHEALANALARAMYPPPTPGAPPGERGMPPPETKLLQHRLDELCAKHVAAAVAGAGAGAAATPNAQTPDTSVACVLTCVSALAERHRKVVDRYLPHLVKLLSRLTHELNQASAAGNAPPPRAPTRGAPPTPPAPEYGSAAHVMSRCVALIASRVVPSGGEHKQLFLRMLLQLINDPNTHGAVLMAALDAVKGWADDAVAGAVPGAVGDAAAIPASVLAANAAKKEPVDTAVGDGAETEKEKPGDDDTDVDDETPTARATRGGKERPGPRGGKEKPGAEAAREKAAAEKAAREAEEDDDDDDGGDEKDEKEDTTKAEGKDVAEAKASPEKPEKPPQAASPFPEPNRPGSLSVKETVLFLSKLAHLTRLGREVTQTTEWEEKLLGTLHSLCAFEGTGFFQAPHTACLLGPITTTVYSYW